MAYEQTCWEFLSKTSSARGYAPHNVEFDDTKMNDEAIIRVLFLV